MGIKLFFFCFFYFFHSILVFIFFSATEAVQKLETDNSSLKNCLDHSNTVTTEAESKLANLQLSYDRYVSITSAAYTLYIEGLLPLPGHAVSFLPFKL